MRKRNLQSTYFKAQNSVRVNKMEANPSILSRNRFSKNRCRLLTRREESTLFFRNYKTLRLQNILCVIDCRRYIRSYRNVPDPSQLEFQLCFLGTAQGEKISYGLEPLSYFVRRGLPSRHVPSVRSSRIFSRLLQTSRTIDRYAKPARNRRSWNSPRKWRQRKNIRYRIAWRAYSSRTSRS